MSIGGLEISASVAGKWLFAAVIVSSGLALGSIPPPVLGVMSALAALSLVLLASDRPGWRPSTAARWALSAIVLVTAFTALQAVPLPHGVVRAIAPANAEIWERCLSPLREGGPAWHTVSVAPGATRLEVLRGLFYACVLTSALRVASLERGEQFLVRLVVGASVVMALAALAHTAVGAERVFGVYRPRETYAYRAGRLTPLLNTNHLAAYLNIGACVALSALVARRSMPRALSASAVLVLAGTSLWQFSRGGTGTLALGALAAIGLTLYVRRGFGGVHANAAILAGCAIAASFMAIISLVDPAENHLFSNDLTKADVARSAWRLVAASPWLGSGRGSFETVFSSVRVGSTYVTFTHPEDLAVQWVVEWGVPLSLLAAGLFAWALRPQLVLRAARPVVGAWVAIVVAVVHDIVDFHLEVPGVVALVMVCVAIVVSGRSSSRSHAHAPENGPRWWPAIAMVAGTLAAVAWAWPSFGHLLAEDRRRASASSTNAAIAPETFRDDLRASMLRYPAEPFFPLMGAVRAQTMRDESVLPWVARALERDPRFGRAHLVLARSLVGGHEAQARLAYRLAYEYDTWLRETIVKEALRVVDGPDAALELVPDGAAGDALLEGLGAELASRLPSTAARLDEELLKRQPTARGPKRRRAEALVSDVVGNASWCAGATACAAEARRAADDLARLEPERCGAHVLIARLGVAAGQTQTALEQLQRMSNDVTDRAQCRRELIMLSLAAGDQLRADRALDGLLRAGCGDAAECIQLYAWAANVELSRGRYVRAVKLERRIFDLDPAREDLLEHIGSLGEKDGVLADALDAYSSLALRHPSDVRWPARIAELKKRHAPTSPLLDPALPGPP